MAKNGLEEYKGINYKIGYCSYKIFFPKKEGGYHVSSFEAYAGNKILEMDEKQQIRKLKAMVRYEINLFNKFGGDKK